MLIWMKKHLYCRYRKFRLSSDGHYVLKVASGYTGNAGNGLAASLGAAFSTRDVDRDASFFRHCAEERGGGWWHPGGGGGGWYQTTVGGWKYSGGDDGCAATGANLNGLSFHGVECPPPGCRPPTGIVWPGGRMSDHKDRRRPTKPKQKWLKTWTKVRMMVRPTRFAAAAEATTTTTTTTTTTRTTGETTTAATSLSPSPSIFS